MTLPKAKTLSTASSRMCLVVGNDLLVRRGDKFAFKILFHFYHKREKCLVSQQVNMFLMDPEPRVIFFVKFNSDFHDMLSDRTLLNFDFRQTQASQGLLPPLQKALAFNTERFHFIPWTSYI